MDWIITLATGIAVLRLCLICGGMWALLKSTARPEVFLDFQKKCFAAAGIIYLLGLLPQSLLLLLVNSNLANVVLDSGYLCWAQNLACMVAAALHSVVFLKWIADCLSYQSGDKLACVTSVLRHRWFGCFLIIYTLGIVVSKGLLLQDDEGEYFTDIAAKSTDTTVADWTTSTVKNPSQIVRLQLLLCEYSLSDDNILSYLVASYSFLLPTLPLLCALLIQRLQKARGVVKNTEDEISSEEEQRVWWEQEVNIQRLLSTSIVFWFHLVQPVIFTTYKEHFVDFGSHLMLTICVFIPWTHSETEYNPLQRWV